MRSALVLYVASFTLNAGSDSLNLFHHLVMGYKLQLAECGPSLTPYFTKRSTKIQREEGTIPRSHSWLGQPPLPSHREPFALQLLLQVYRSTRTTAMFPHHHPSRDACPMWGPNERLHRNAEMTMRQGLGSQ